MHTITMLPRIGSSCGAHELSVLDRIRRLRRDDCDHISEDCRFFTAAAMRRREARKQPAQRVVVINWRTGARTEV